MKRSAVLILVCVPVFVDLNSPLLFGRLNGLSSDSTIDILYQLGTTQDSGTKDRYVKHPVFTLTQAVLTPFSVRITPNEKCFPSRWYSRQTHKLIVKSLLTLSLPSFTVSCLCLLHINSTVTQLTPRDWGDDSVFTNLVQTYLSKCVVNFNPPGSRLSSSGSMTLQGSQPTRWVVLWDTPPAVVSLPLLHRGSTASSCLHPPTFTVWQPSCGIATSCLLTTTSPHCSTESSLSQSLFFSYILNVTWLTMRHLLG